MNHFAFEPCYKLLLEDKRTKLKVTTKHLSRWLHLPKLKNSDGMTHPREINIHSSQIDGDITKLLFKLRKVRRLRLL